MKINNSVIQFKRTCIRKRDGSYYTMDEIPYWKLYVRKGDNFYTPGETFAIVRPLTYKEIVDYLENTPLHHVYDAYPRFSMDIRGPRERKSGQ